MEMKNILKEQKWDNYSLSFFDNLNLYLAEKKQDYTKEYEESDREIGLVDSKGEWVYKCSENELLLLKHHSYCSKAEESLNKSLQFWSSYKNIGSTDKPVGKISIFKYECGHVIELVPEFNLKKSLVISQHKIVIGILNDVKNITEPEKINIKILDTKTNELVDVIEAIHFEDERFGNQLEGHIVFGGHSLFSVKVEQLDDRENEQFHLFDNNGRMLLNYKITHGNNGEYTWFEPTKTGFGITYKLLPHKLKIDHNESINTSACLIDFRGNHYGEFLTIQGANPNIGIKSYTKYPKFIEQKLLCLTLPNNDNISYLVLFDKEGKRIDTPYQCPWVNTTLFNQCAFIADKKYFGKKCLAIINQDNMVQLIDFEGNLVNDTGLVKFDGIHKLYPKYFIDQIT